MKVIVAGAGHGGLVAASKLAKFGYDVTVYEKKQKEELGHDWEDRFTFDLLLKIIEKDELPKEVWRYRGNCVFVSPSKRTNVEIRYTDETRQKIMWRKPLINMLLDYAEKCGVKFEFGTEVKEPIIKEDTVVGIKTNKGEILGDIVIDALGVFSVLRKKLPDTFGIEKELNRGDVFYGYRAYFNKIDDSMPEFPFEVYLYHEREQGLSWCCVNKDNVDILIGRIDELTKEKVEEQLKIFKENHPCIGDTILHGGQYGVIPVRRPLPLMVANGYALVGDSAFMTTPMNGMGIDLSMNAGLLLAETLINKADASIENLWNYNREYHKQFGGPTAKNEGLKNSLLKLPYEGVDFLYDNAVIQSSDLAGAGKNMKLGALLGKFVRGMKKPKYFFAIIKGLIKGSKAAKTYTKAPKEYNIKAIKKWEDKLNKLVIKID